MHTVYGISLGPGDPELLTVKALRILKESDVIFYPGSSFNGKKKSFVYPILSYHGLDVKILQGFYLEMSSYRDAAKKVYTETVQKIQQAYQSGKKICIVCEGDLSLYASFSYILEKLQHLLIPVTLIPGITSFALGASQHQIPLCLLEEKVAIVPKVQHMEEIITYFKGFDTLVLMKIRSGWSDFKTQLLQQNWTCYYCERLGTEEEFITTDLTRLSSRKIPYFSLLIIKK